MKSVLVVEDEFLVALDLKLTLEEQGFGPVRIASDARSALREAASKPQLALVDVNLADGPTGPRIGEQLAREHGTTVLFITANPQCAAEADAGIGILSKPLSADELLAAAAYAAARHDGVNAPPPPKFIPLRRASAG